LPQSHDRLKTIIPERDNTTARTTIDAANNAADF
jgi:hypothetical protein